MPTTPWGWAATCGAPSRAGHIDGTRGRRWFDSLSQGPFFATFTLVTVIGSR
ncbi:hypothetical protein [Streptomyces sp. TE33382]